MRHTNRPYPLHEQVTLVFYILTRIRICQAYSTSQSTPQPTNVSALSENQSAILVVDTRKTATVRLIMILPLATLNGLPCSHRTQPPSPVNAAWQERVRTTHLGMQNRPQPFRDVAVL